jgi:hypothetical protein
LDGATATHLLRVSYRPAGLAAVPGAWTSLDRWDRWTYLFRYNEPISGRQGVAYAEDESHRASQSVRPPVSSSIEKGEGEPLWLPETTSREWVGPGHCELLRTVPESVRLPVVAMSRQDGAAWLTSAVHEWARPLFTPAMQRHVRFLPNQDTPPRVYASPEEMAQDHGRKRPRRRT